MFDSRTVPEGMFHLIPKLQLERKLPLLIPKNYGLGRL